MPAMQVGDVRGVPWCRGVGSRRRGKYHHEWRAESTVPVGGVVVGCVGGRGEVEVVGG